LAGTTIARDVLAVWRNWEREGEVRAIGNSKDSAPVRRAAGPIEDLRTSGRLGWILGAVGLAALVVSFALSPANARSAAAQDWSPFVLVTGLLLIGLVANRDGLFAAAGHHLARSARGGPMLFVGATIMIAVVTALLNLDTSVAFLTPTLLYAARSRGGGEAPLLYGCVLLSNAGSLFLPGANLTNLIVLGHFHVSGLEFLSHMWAPALAALVVTAAVIAVIERRSLRLASVAVPEREPFTLGIGAVAVAASTLCVLVLDSPAIAVAIIGIGAVGIRIARGREQVRPALGVVGVPTLVGLFGLATALGTLGRVWSGPAVLLSHLDLWGTAAVAALSSVLVNNLPAASLLAARTPAHPYALLIGLNVGPNLFVTGALSWLIWMRSARVAGFRPSLARASRIGVLAVPLSMAAAVAILAH